MAPELPVIFQTALEERGLVFHAVQQIDQDSKLITGMRTFVFANDSHQLRLSFGEENNAFSIGVEELATKRAQTFGFYAPPAQNLKISVEKALDSSSDLLPILRGQKAPSNRVDWGDYK